MSVNRISGGRAGERSATARTATSRQDRQAESASSPPRILVVDDSPSIHDDFRKILDTEAGLEVDALAGAIFADAPPAGPPQAGRSFAVDSAHQGQEALAMVRRAREQGRPYAVAFVDVRMPPGWDGLETLVRIWEDDPRVEAVLCTAYSDYSWEQILARVGDSDQLLILKKPFEMTEVRQLTHALVAKWELARANEQRIAELEARVSERTRALALANEQLRHESSERERGERELHMAQRLEGLGRLAAGIGHEINNPLTFMTTGIEALGAELADIGDVLSGGSRAEVAELLDAAAIGADRISQIVRSMQLFGKPEERRDIELVDMASVIALSLRMVASDLGGIELETHIDEVPSILGKRVALEQVFVNLLQNAAHALAAPGPAGRGERDRRISVRCRCDDGRNVVVEISDTGPGIPREHLDKIFDPFFTTKPVNQGTGLGLSICHTIIRDLGGDIDVRSTEGQGTTVSVRLSAARLGSPELAALLPAPEAAPAHEPGTSRGRILVVDDEPLILRMMSHALRDHEVVGVTSGRDAMARMAGSAFDVILCDLMMPGMSGMELYDEVRASFPGLEQRVAFMSGGTLLPGVQQFLDQVPNPCLEKPVSVRRLQTFIEERVRLVQEPGS